jgi:hypothetical protein
MSWTLIASAFSTLLCFRPLLESVWQSSIEVCLQAEVL